MLKISSTDATIYAAQDLINLLQNPEPARPLVTLVNAHKEPFISLADIFGKSTSPAVPTRVPVRGEYQEKLQQLHQEENQIKNLYQ